MFTEDKEELTVQYGTPRCRGNDGLHSGCRRAGFRSEPCRHFRTGWARPVERIGLMYIRYAWATRRTNRAMWSTRYPQTESHGVEVLGTHLRPHPDPKLLSVGHREDWGVISQREMRPGTDDTRLVFHIKLDGWHQRQQAEEWNVDESHGRGFGRHVSSLGFLFLTLTSLYRLITR